MIRGPALLAALLVAAPAAAAGAVTRNHRLEWWTKGDGGFLAVPGVQPPILDHCRPL